jgi:hypothetical protein
LFKFPGPLLTEPQVLQILKKDRDCKTWYAYTPGKSPKEHLDDFRVQELESRRQEFEQRMDREHKEFMLQLDKRNRNFQIRLAVVLGIFAITEVVAAFLQVGCPTGWPWLMKFTQPAAAPPPMPEM